MVEDFLLEDEKFLQWKKDRGFRVTETTLVDFPLGEIRRLLGEPDGGLEHLTNRDHRALLAIID